MPSMIPITGESMPTGFSTALVPSSGPALNAEPTNASANAAAANQATARQRGVSGRPVGKRRGRKVNPGRMAKTHAQLPAHRAYATMPGSSPVLRTTCRYSSLLKAMYMKKNADEHHQPADRVARLPGHDHRAQDGEGQPP